MYNPQLAAPPAHWGMPWPVPICAQERDVKIAETNKGTFWLVTTPLLCGGCGVAPCRPLCAEDGKCCCVENHCYTEDACGGDSGCCYTFSKWCCCVSHGVFPPGGGKGDGAPMCALCNVRCGDDDPSEVAQNPRAQTLKGAFLLYYCFCTGCGVGRCADPLVMGSSKCCCVRSETFTAEACSEDKPCCFNYSKTCCCIGAEIFPCFGGRTDGLPGCACCGQTLCLPPLDRHL
uniref:Uncharacterized protein n=1 Tax=Zooxanthella nutricula TaxID=1333877 RepID=A0A7S2M6Q9_9DINO